MGWAISRMPPARRLRDIDIEREGICPECGGTLGVGIALGYLSHALCLLPTTKCPDCGHTPGLSGFLVRPKES